jgi:UDP-N-acetylglucosamine 1-carboxyvinyltransferase
MSERFILTKQSQALHGIVELTGAKNAVLVIIASLLLAEGKSTLYNVPNSADVRGFIALMTELGALVHFDVRQKILTVDTSTVNSIEVSPEIMNKMRASILVMGPLLARFGKARVALPGGCLIGARPINYHLHGFRNLGVSLEENKPYLFASINKDATTPMTERISLEYPSVGATENFIMYATLKPGETVIVNAAIEPEVLDLIDILTRMGAKIYCEPGQIVRIVGVTKLNPVEHTVIPDRLEAGALLLAACISKGSVHLPNARADHMDIFLEKLREMGHEVYTGTNQTPALPLQGISLKACHEPRGVSIKTAPYPGFPTDLQAPMMTAMALSRNISMVEETVFENRLMHVKELTKMGAQITVEGQKATIRGVEKLYGAELIATDIRASCGLVLAGLVAVGETKIGGVHHWERGYDKLEEKLRFMGASVRVFDQEDDHSTNSSDFSLDKRVA